MRINSMNVTKKLASLAVTAVVVAQLSLHPARAESPSATANVPGGITPPPTAAADSQLNATETGKGPFDWLDSKLPIHFTLNYTNYYDDNIYISPNKTSDYVFNISPGLSYSLGQEGESDNYLSLIYVPTIIEYYTNSQQDAVDQHATMVYEHNFQKLKLSLSQSYAHTNQTSIQAGTIVVSNLYNTALAAHYDYSDKLSINADFAQDLSYYPGSGYTNFYEWSGGAYFLYQVLPKVSLGFGPRIGTDHIVNQPDQTWEQALLHATYSATEKLTFTASGGAEFRQYETSAVGNKVSGVFSLGGYWTPFEGTGVNLTAYRRNTPSYSIGGTNMMATGISAGVRQNFLQSFYLGINGGYENDAYSAAAPGVTGARNDNYYFVHPYFQWNAKDWLQLVAYYQYSANDSNLSSVSFNDNQVGFTVNFRY